MEGEGQFDHAEVRSEVTAVFGENSNEFMPDFLRQFRQLRERQFLDVQRRVHHLKILAHNLRVVQVVQIVRFSSFQVQGWDA
jgi:hypothetical protein